MKALTQKTYLKDLDLLESLYYINFANVNEPYNELHGELIAVIDKNTPDKTLIKGEQKQNKKTIDYQKFQKSIKTKSIYQKKIAKIQSKFLYGRCKYYSNAIDKLITRSKNNNLRELLPGNLLKLSKINEMLHIQTKTI